MSLGPLELLLIIFLVLILFGAGRVPNIMENFGKGINSFKKGLREEDVNIKSLKTAEKEEKVSKDAE